jgi:antitoxin component YwqK of YwqJK toxin-antitoxin module
MLLRFILPFIVLLSACSGNETIKVHDDNGVLTEEYRRNKKDFAKNGPYLAFYPDGAKLEEARYVRDTLDGIRKRFFPNGQVQVEEPYRMGSFEGIFKSYYESGRLELEGAYVNNAMSGIWKRYYENGQLLEEVRFENNEENGPFIEYHENGKLKAKGAYLDGDNEHGLLELFDENGELERKMECQKGVCKTVWLRDTAEQKQ